MDIFPEPDSRTASGGRISNPLSVNLLKLNMRTRVERDKLWLLQCRATPLPRDLWGVVVSYYADDPRIIDLISPGVELHLSARYVFRVSEYSESCSDIELSGFIARVAINSLDPDYVDALGLFQMILILPMAYGDGSESTVDDQGFASDSDPDSGSDTCLDSNAYISKYIPQIRDKLYKRLAELDDAAA